jgi:site-specific recombinase XerD
MNKILEKINKILLLRNYSPKTRKVYLLYIKNYITFSEKTGIKNRQKAIEEFLLDRYKQKQSPQTINLSLSAIKFFYTEVLKNPQKIDLKFAKNVPQKSCKN